MKNGIYFVILLILVPLVVAKTEYIDLEKDQSYRVSDSNITLLSVNSENDKIILCVNNNKYILSEESSRNLKNLIIDLKDIYNNDKVRLKLESSCSNCICKEDCSNIDCYGKTAEEVKEEPQEEQPETEEKKIEVEVKGYKPKIEESNGNLFIIPTIIMLIIIIVTAISLKKKEE
ncbi:MAG: hypothetical protein PHT54_02810 [Candidatus Nanoarchaeia archaeon]|nr:hypothetical protein [Candidatus Nanoarchaeia archaeon]